MCCVFWVVCVVVCGVVFVCVLWCVFFVTRVELMVYGVEFLLTNSFTDLELDLGLFSHGIG